MNLENYFEDFLIGQRKMKYGGENLGFGIQ